MPFSFSLGTAFSFDPETYKCSHGCLARNARRRRRERETRKRANYGTHLIGDPPAHRKTPDKAIDRLDDLPTRAAGYHALRMFLITEADADAIRAIFTQEGELSAAIELRRRFPGITDNAKARAQVRIIAGWKPLPSPPCSVIRPRPRGESRDEFRSQTAPETPATEPTR